LWQDKMAKLLSTGRRKNEEKEEWLEGKGIRVK
jgi:hypothetical protein